MAKTRFSATYADQTFFRTSARHYTHMVIARPSHRYDVWAAEQPKRWKIMGENFDYAHSVIAAGKRPGARYAGWSDAEFADLCAAHVAEAVKAVRGFRADQRAEYVAKLQEEALAAIEAKRKAGHYMTFEAIGWCGRADLAQKLKATTEGRAMYEQALILEVEG